MKRPETKPYGPSLEYPIPGLPFRRIGGEHVRDEMGLDRRWEHCLVVVNSNGDIIESWTQWDSMFKHPHAVFVNPYDPQKNVWVVDDGKQAIFKFTHDGKELLQTIGTPGVEGSDDTHFGRPTYLAWFPDGTMFLSDGYDNTRVVKFDKNGKYLMAWGQKGTPPNETRPGYMNSVHGIVVDPTTRRVFVNDRANRRTQVFDENGKFLDEWSFGPFRPCSLRICPPTVTSGPPIRHLKNAEVRSWRPLPLFLGQHSEIGRGPSGACIRSAWIRKAISTSRKFRTAARRNSARAKAPIPDYLVGTSAPRSMMSPGTLG